MQDSDTPQRSRAEELQIALDAARRGLAEFAGHLRAAQMGPHQPYYLLFPPEPPPLSEAPVPYPYDELA